MEPIDSVDIAVVAGIGGYEIINMLSNQNITKNGEKKWEHETQISNPILSVSGKYIAVAGKDSTHLNLYKGKKLLYAIDIPDRIKTCSVSEKGDVALITDKTAYKGAVSVFNKKGEEVFSWIIP